MLLVLVFSTEDAGLVLINKFSQEYHSAETATLDRSMSVELSYDKQVIDPFIHTQYVLISIRHTILIRMSTY